MLSTATWNIYFTHSYLFPPPPFLKCRSSPANNHHSLRQKIPLPSFRPPLKDVKNILRMNSTSWPDCFLHDWCIVVYELSVEGILLQLMMFPLVSFLCVYVFCPPMCLYIYLYIYQSVSVLFIHYLCTVYIYSSVYLSA